MGRVHEHARACIAALVVLGLLSATTALLVREHRHGSLPGRSCDICRSAQLPLGPPEAQVELQSPELLEWHAAATELSPEAAQSFLFLPSRGPPA